jgi:hypothetical protein
MIYPMFHILQAAMEGDVVIALQPISYSKKVSIHAEDVVALLTDLLT